MAEGGSSSYAEVDGSLAIRHLTLYNNGYGVFQREATVSGRGSIDLFFRGIHMEDVLKSLCFR